MAEYTHYAKLDPEWVEFEKTFTPVKQPEDLSVAKKQFNETRAALFQRHLGPIGGVSTEDAAVPTRDCEYIQVRLYFPNLEEVSSTPLPLLIYLHGGGYLKGNIESEDMHCRILCVQTPCIVLNVNYRHTPEWTFPTPYTDVFDAVDWITETQKAQQYGVDLENVIMAGVSAGATMAIAAALVEIEKRTHRLKGIEVSCPLAAHWTRFPRHLVANGYSSFEQNANAPLLSMARLGEFYNLFKADPESPYMSSLLMPDTVLKQFPPTAVHVCGADPLRDGGLLLEERLRHLGVSTHLQVYGGFPHTFWNQPQLKASGAYRKRLVEDAQWLFSHQDGLMLYD